MKRIVKLGLALVFTVGLVALAASPASANTGVGIFTGEATVTPGLNFPDPVPPTDPGSASWSINASNGCLVTAGDNAPNVRTGATDCRHAARNGSRPTGRTSTPKYQSVAVSAWSRTRIPVRTPGLASPSSWIRLPLLWVRPGPSPRTWIT